MLKKSHFFAVFFFSFLFSFIQVRSFDLFFYLKVAELESFFSPLQQNFFSYTFPYYSYRNYSFLFSETVFLISKYFGLSSLTIFQSFVVALSYLIISKSVFKKPHLLFLLFALITSIFTVRYRLLFRPHNLSYLFFAINIYLLVIKPKYDYYYHFINQMLWVNTHNGFILGFVNLLLLYPYNRKLKISLHKTILALLLGSLASLNFYHPFIEVINPFIGETKGIFDSLKVHEWQYTDSKLYFSYYGLLILISFYVLVKEKKWRLLPFYLFYLALSIRFVRFIDFFAFVAFFVMISGVKEKILSSDKKLRLTKIAIFTVFFVITLQNYFFNPLIPCGYGVANYFYPKNAVLYMKNNDIKGNVFNSYAFGGYIIYNLYPESKPAIDGRLCYPLDFIKLYADAHEKKESFRKIIEKFTPDIFLIDFEHPAIALFISETKNYALVYFDDEAMVFLKRDKFKNIIRRDEITYLNPIYVAGYGDDNVNTKIIKLELEKILKRIPSNRGYVMYANIFINEGKFDEARILLEKVIGSSSPAGKAEAFNNLGTIKLNEGNFKEAVTFYKKALKFNPDLLSAHLNLGQIYENSNDYLLAFYHYKKFKENNEENIPEDFYDRYNYIKKQSILSSIKIAVAFFAFCGIIYIIFFRGKRSLSLKIKQ